MRCSWQLLITNVYNPPPPTAPSVANVQSAIEEVYPLVSEFRKERTLEEEARRNASQYVHFNHDYDRGIAAGGGNGSSGGGGGSGGIGSRFQGGRRGMSKPPPPVDDFMMDENNGEELAVDLVSSSSSDSEMDEIFS